MPAYKVLGFTQVIAQLYYSVIHSLFMQFVSVKGVVTHSIHKTYNYLLLFKMNIQVIRMGTI